MLRHRRTFSQAALSFGSIIDRVRVLVVEDDVKMAAAIRRGLRFEGLVVDLASGGEEALRMVAATDYDAVVLDVMMPQVDGFEMRSNVVEVYVRYLREKIDRPFGVRSLETVRGMGYRLRRDGGA